MTCNGATGPVGARGTTEHGSDHPWRGEAHGHHVHSKAMSATPIETGVLPTGQVVGVIEELPTVATIVERVMREATETLARLGSN